MLIGQVNVNIIARDGAKTLGHAKRRVFWRRAGSRMGKCTHHPT